MRAVILIAAFAMAEAAIASCKEDLAEVDKLSAEVQTTDVQRAQLKQQREAALLLMNSGQDDLCKDVVHGIEEILEKQREANMMARERTERLQEVQTATPLPAQAGVVRASDVIGLPVRNKSGDKLGTIEDIAIDASSGVIAYAALRHGGFLGLGEKRIAIPWRELARTADGDAIVLDVDDSTLDKAAGFDEQRWPETYDPQWRRETGVAGPAPEK
jgi:sporulation protein YlmC with PRC-barrel domain/outer membrane murein-binding lipoprotein Lpp